MWGAIRNVATAIGVTTGAGTIVGWIVSTESPAVVAGTAVGYAGMVYCGGFALLGFVATLLPRGLLVAQGVKDSAKAVFKARAMYFGYGCLFAAIFAGIGTDPLDGTWITLGGIALVIVAYVTVIAQRAAVTKRKGEIRECPDCAETIKTKARVCRYCGYRFAVPPPAGRP